MNAIEGAQVIPVTVPPWYLEDIGDRVSPIRAQNVLREMRAEHSFLKDEPSSMLDAGEEITWWTFAGGKANGLLARMIEAEFGVKCTVRNVSITCREEAGKSRAALGEFIRRLAAEGRPGQADAQKHAEGAARGRVSKFEPCLPERLLQELLAEIVVDVEGAKKAVAQAVTARGEYRDQ